MDAFTFTAVILLGLFVLVGWLIYVVAKYGKKQ